MFLTTPKKHPGAGVTTTKKLRGKPNFRRPASPPRWRRRGTTSCWAAARRCAAPWDALHVPGGGAVVAAHKIAAVAKRGGEIGLGCDMTAVGCRSEPICSTSLIAQHFSLLLQKFEKSSRKWRFLEESCPLPARLKPRSSRALKAPKSSWRPKRFLTTAQKHCGKPKI